jgi:hypothetical protein
MTDPTHSPRPHTLAAMCRSSLATIGRRQLADGRTVDRRHGAREAYRAVRKMIPPQRTFKEEAKAICAEIAALAVRTTSPHQQNGGEAR